MNILFWNVYGNKQINSLLTELIIQTDADIVGVCEYDSNALELVKNLNSRGSVYYLFPIVGCRRILVISKINHTQVELCHESEYYTIRKFPYCNHQSLIVAFVHLPTLFLKENDKLDIADELRENIERVENNTGCMNSIIVGDYNMNPYDKGVYSANGLNAIPDADVAKKNKRSVRNKDRVYFYNPMWNIMGDVKAPTGSYYKAEGSVECVFWNLFDQVCIRPSLIESFEYDKLMFITEINGVELLKNGIPNKKISDHLPLSFEL